jgi:Mrp family chromosome partitioning ATPase
MFVDMPPGTGDVSLSVFQSIPVDGIIIVASPQELVSMVVEKAVKMAEMMEIPIVGLVENMSYLACPDCGKKIYLFGEGKTHEAAKRHNLSVLAEMPIDPALAALVDAGNIEAFQGSWLDHAADLLEGKE